MNKKHTKMPSINFGKNLRDVMYEKRVKQYELAEITGISSSTLSQYATNYRTPKLDQATLIANALDVSLDILCGRGDKYLKQTEVLDSEQKEIYDIYKKLNSFGKDHLLNTLHILKDNENYIKNEQFDKSYLYNTKPA